jgi:hypothetical protein
MIKEFVEGPFNDTGSVKRFNRGNDLFCATPARPPHLLGRQMCGGPSGPRPRVRYAARQHPPPASGDSRRSPSRRGGGTADILPKVLVVNRYTQGMLTNYQQIKLDQRVQVVVNMDGFGSPRIKGDAYKSYVALEPVQFTGFKLFLQEGSADEAA